MLPEALQALLLLNVSCKTFKDVLRTHAQRLDRGAKLGQQFLISQEGDAHREQLFIVVNSCHCKRNKVFAYRCSACLMRLKHFVKGWQVLGYERKEDVFFMVEMPIKCAFRQTHLARDLLGGHVC